MVCDHMDNRCARRYTSTSAFDRRFCQALSVSIGDNVIVATVNDEKRPLITAQYLNCSPLGGILLPGDGVIKLRK
jgi:hypothetical protein